jgi:hypothetical protein
MVSCCLAVGRYVLGILSLNQNYCRVRYSNGFFCEWIGRKAMSSGRDGGCLRDFVLLIIIKFLFSSSIES